MTALRAAARLCAVLLLLVLMLPPHGLARLRGRSPWPRRFLAAAARAMGARVRVAGRPLVAHALLVANHRSWLDIPILAGASGARFVSKAEVGRWPLVGWLARLNGTLFVERARRSAAGEQADTVRDALAAGAVVALFPEGTTHHGAGLLPFRPALFAAAAPPPPGVRVQPVRIDYGPAEALVSWPEGESAPANMRRVLGARGGFAVRVAFLEPLPPGEDRKAIAAEARAAIAAAA